jgi:hypothetical protein
MDAGRRSFLIRSGMTAAACCGGPQLFDRIPNAFAAATAPTEFPQPCSADSWEKKGVVLEPDQPWEGKHVENFMSSIDPLDGGRWRIWYCANSPRQGYIGIAVAEGVPGEPMTKHRAVLSDGKPEDAPLAIGNIPKNWRLACPTHIRLKDGRHRIYFFAQGTVHGKVAQRYLAADSDDGRRYRVIDPDLPCIYTVWDRTTNKKLPAGVKLEDIQSNDGATVYQLPDGTFEMFVQDLEPIDEKDPRYVAHDNIPKGFRVIDRLTSEDGITFNHRQRRVLAPDKDDPIDTQFYMLSVTHTSRGRVGVVSWYRVRAGNMELQYTHSNDGVHWQRVRQPWIKRGAPGSPDSVTIYQPSSMIFHDNKWWLFYTGVNYTHSTLQGAKPGEEQRSVIMLATTPSLFS